MEYFEVLEADFFREYHVNLAEILWGENPMDCRRLWVLIQGLSADAIFRHVYQPPSKEKVASTQETLKFFEKQGAIKRG